MKQEQLTNFKKQFIKISIFDGLSYEGKKVLLENVSFYKAEEGEIIWDAQIKKVIILIEGSIAIIDNIGQKEITLLLVQESSILSVHHIGRKGQVRSKSCIYAVLVLYQLLEQLEQDHKVYHEFKCQQQDRINLIDQFYKQQLKLYQQEQNKKDLLEKKMQCEAISSSFTPAKMEGFKFLKDNYRVEKKYIVLAEKEQQLYQNLMRNKKFTERKCQLNLEKRLQLPFADFKLPGNYMAVFDMPRNKRQLLVDIAKKYKLSEEQNQIVSTDQYYRQKIAEEHSQILEKQLMRMKEFQQKKSDDLTDVLKDDSLPPIDSINLSRQADQLSIQQVISQISLPDLSLPLRFTKPKQKQNFRMNQIIVDALKQTKAIDEKQQALGEQSIYSKLKESLTFQKYLVRVSSQYPCKSNNLQILNQRFKSSKQQKSQRIQKEKSLVVLPNTVRDSFKDDETQTINEDDIDDWMSNRHDQSQVQKKEIRRKEPKPRSFSNKILKSLGDKQIMIHLKM